MRIILAVFLFMLAACGPIAVNTTQHQMFDAEARRAFQPEYRIGRGDELEVKFTFNPEMNEKVPVRPDGRISLPLAKQIMVAGLTTAELEEILRQKYAAELKRPDVTVVMRGFHGQKVFVDGEIGRPGLVPIMEPMNLMELIAQAGGLKETARIHEILIIRRTKEKPQVTIVDFEKALDNTDMSQNIYLMPSDIVYVPRSRIANVNLWVDQYLRRMIPFTLPQVIPTPSYILQQGSPPVY